jgi:CelD/BcsL family acetyltransferase involved in cellulose biosynthesis
VGVGRVRPGARVAVLEEGPEVVGFFPYERGPLRVGRPIGAGLSDCQGLVHTPDLEWDRRELLRGAGLNVWEFDHLLATQRPFAPYHRARRPSAVAVARRLQHAPRRYVTDFVLGRPALRSTVRQLLRRVGQLRSGR